MSDTHIGNPIRIHGKGGLYSSVPAALYETSSISLAGLAAACVLYRHRDGWEVSIGGIAKTMNRSRKTIQGGVQSLIDHRWLAREDQGMNRSIWHLAASEPFSPAEHEALNTYSSSVKLGAKVVQKINHPSCTNDTTPSVKSARESSSSQSASQSTDIDMAPSCPLGSDDDRLYSEFDDCFSDHQLTPMSDRWHVKGPHVTVANRYGINAKELAAIFVSWAWDRQSRNWDRWFASVLLAVGGGDTYETTFGRVGVDLDAQFAFIDEHGDVNNWWERDSGSRIWSPPKYPGSNFCRNASIEAGVPYLQALSDFNALHYETGMSAMHNERTFCRLVKEGAIGTGGRVSVQL